MKFAAKPFPGSSRKPIQPQTFLQKAKKKKAKKAASEQELQLKKEAIEQKISNLSQAQDKFLALALLLDLKRQLERVNKQLVAVKASTQTHSKQRRQFVQRKKKPVFFLDFSTIKDEKKPDAADRSDDDANAGNECKGHSAESYKSTARPVPAFQKAPPITRDDAELEPVKPTASTSTSWMFE